jgi:hypothetical protein
VKLFLYKFVEDKDLVQIKKEILLEKIFDRGIKKAFSSEDSKEKAQYIADKLLK